MTIRVLSLDYTQAFRKDLAAAPPDAKKAAAEALKLLLKNPSAKTLRLHPLKGYAKPTIFKIDVYANRSWQITFELEGTKAVLRRISTHNELDRRPR